MSFVKAMELSDHVAPHDRYLPARRSRLFVEQRQRRRHGNRRDVMSAVLEEEGGGYECNFGIAV